jgi:hypothetical protein
MTGQERTQKIGKVYLHRDSINANPQFNAQPDPNPIISSSNIFCVNPSIPLLWSRRDIHASDNNVILCGTTRKQQRGMGYIQKEKWCPMRNKMGNIQKKKQNM